MLTATTSGGNIGSADNTGTTASATGPDTTETLTWGVVSEPTFKPVTVPSTFSWVSRLWDDYRRDHRLYLRQDLIIGDHCLVLAWVVARVVRVAS